MEAKELKTKSSVELTKMADERRAELRALRFKVATRQHGKVRDLRRIRQEIAQIETAKTAANTNV
ncbi:MAG: 50S ribosomal protein L29 [Candidatus Uhrbacteria bacterium]